MDKILDLYSDYLLCSARQIGAIDDVGGGSSPARSVRAQSNHLFAVKTAFPELNAMKENYPLRNISE